jgi:hypothetical protein
VERAHSGRSSSRGARHLNAPAPLCRARRRRRDWLLRGGLRAERPKHDGPTDARPVEPGPSSRGDRGRSHLTSRHRRSAAAVSTAPRASTAPRWISAPRSRSGPSCLSADRRADGWSAARAGRGPSSPSHDRRVEARSARELQRASLRDDDHEIAAAGNPGRIRGASVGRHHAAAREHAGDDVDAASRAASSRAASSSSSAGGPRHLHAAAARVDHAVADQRARGDPHQTAARVARLRIPRRSIEPPAPSAPRPARLAEVIVARRHIPPEPRPRALVSAEPAAEARCSSRPTPLSS